MRNFIWAAAPIFLGMALCASADTITPGTQIQVRTEQPIEMHTWDRGRVFPARVDRDVAARDGDVAIPHGAQAELIVRQVGPGQMVLDLESVTVNGKRYALDASGPEYNGDQYRNGGGLLGNVVGAITGGKVQVITRGSEINVPQDATITFQLQAPLHMVGWGDPGYDRGGDHYHRDNDWYR